ncbi:MAG TPA: response regulator [Alphaproteobacteria bacterium]|nr:response regulator [Alphaproteobacteria bacterium]
MALPRVLVIDDRADDRRTVREAAEHLGFRVQDTADAGEFRNHVLHRPPAVAVIDLIMPQVDGVELLRFLAESGFAGDIVLLNDGDADLLAPVCSLARAYGLTVAGSVGKPLDPHDLIGVLSALRPRLAVAAGART